MKPSTTVTAVFCSTCCASSRRAKLASETSTGDREERLLHRLEAFSDIVIGFSLAQTAASLVVEDHFSLAGFFGTKFPGFAVTFLLVASMWWNHNRLFARYFIPDAVSVILNFVTLGFVLLFVYSIQVFMHAPGPDSVIFYAGSFAVMFLLLGVLYLMGAIRRRDVLTQEEFRRGFIRGLRHTCMAAGILIALFILTRVGLHVRTIGYLFFPPALFMIAVTRLAPLFWSPLRKQPAR